MSAVTVYDALATAAAHPRRAVGLETVNMEANGTPNFRLEFGDRRPGGDAARQIRNVGRVSCRCFLDHHCVSFHLSPACFLMLLNVPSATSSPE